MAQHVRALGRALWPVVGIVGVRAVNGVTVSADVVVVVDLAAAIDRAPPPTFVVTNADLKMVGSTDSQPIGACHRVRTGKSS